MAVLPIKPVLLTVAWGLLNILHGEIPQRLALLKEQAEFEGKEHSNINSSDLFPANLNFPVQMEVCFRWDW